jgi:hypothetical protein
MPGHAKETLMTHNRVTFSPPPRVGTIIVNDRHYVTLRDGLRFARQIAEEDAELLAQLAKS